MEVIATGLGMAIQIKVAEELGLEPDFVALADEFLKTGVIAKLCIGEFALSAWRSVYAINELGLNEEAFKLAEKYFKI